MNLSFLSMEKWWERCWPQYPNILSQRQGLSLSIPVKQTTPKLTGLKQQLFITSPNHVCYWGVFLWHAAMLARSLMYCIQPEAGSVLFHMTTFSLCLFSLQNLSQEVFLSEEAPRFPTAWNLSHDGMFQDSKPQCAVLIKLLLRSLLVIHMSHSKLHDQAQSQWTPQRMKEWACRSLGVIIVTSIIDNKVFYTSCCCCC